MIPVWGCSQVFNNNLNKILKVMELINDCCNYDWNYNYDSKTSTLTFWNNQLEHDTHFEIQEISKDDILVAMEFVARYYYDCYIINATFSDLIGGQLYTHRLMHQLIGGCSYNEYMDLPIEEKVNTLKRGLSLDRSYEEAIELKRKHEEELSRFNRVCEDMLEEAEAQGWKPYENIELPEELRNDPNYLPF